MKTLHEARNSRQVACLAFACAVVCLAHAADQPGTAPASSLRWFPDATDHRIATVELIGLDEEHLDELRRLDWSPDRWQQVFSIHAEQGGILDDVGLPPMLGDYRVEPFVVRFTPRFPLEPGIRYRGVFWPKRLPGMGEVKQDVVTAHFQLPDRPPRARTDVSHIAPSSDVLPENLLKFYVHFTAPMSRGRVYDFIHLRDEAGREVELPFLEIDEELWNHAMTRLTLFIDPGRIKRGVRPLEEIGPALEEGRRYTLAIDASWKDGHGNPLQHSFEKKFSVGPPDRDPPDPARWRIRTPGAGATGPLEIDFLEPMDHALARRMIRIIDESDRIVQGTISLEDQERRWTFQPNATWRAGVYRIEVDTTIEDLAGNNIGKPFEVDLVEEGQHRLTRSSVSRSFEIR